MLIVITAKSFSFLSQHLLQNGFDEIICFKFILTFQLYHKANFASVSRITINIEKGWILRYCLKLLSFLVVRTHSTWKEIRFKLTGNCCPFNDFVEYTSKELVRNLWKWSALYLFYLWMPWENFRLYKMPVLKFFLSSPIFYNCILQDYLFPANHLQYCFKRI